MQQLADEFAALVQKTSVATPAIEQLSAYLNPDVAPVELGRADTPMNFRSLILAAELLVGILTIRLLRLRRTLKNWQNG